MSEVQDLVINSNAATTVFAIVAATLSFVIALLVILCDQSLLDPSFQSARKLSKKLTTARLGGPGAALDHN
jgi:hypothetical protein